MGRLLVIGATGMLGSAVISLAVERGIDVVGTTTDLRLASETLAPRLIEYKYSSTAGTAVFDELGCHDYVINCSGLIKHRIDDQVLEQRRAAVELNALFPHAIAALAEMRGFRVVQIATDCVFSGIRGGYSEADLHDAGDVYGQTKSLGEVPSRNCMHIRCSIVGKELRSHRSLLDWAVMQKPDSSISGYVDHLWNGVSTRAFARVAIGLLEAGQWEDGIFHLVPADVVTKYELLKLILREFDREDISLHPMVTPQSVDRSLRTIHGSVNERMWIAGGFETPPTIAEMISDLASENRNSE